MPTSPKPAHELQILAEFPLTLTSSNKPILLPILIKENEYLFLIDTGSSETIFDLSLADELEGWGIFPARGSDTTGTRFSAVRKETPDAYIGPLNLRDHITNVLILDMELMNSRLDEEIHGIIGMDFLKKFTVQIDFDNKQVSFLKTTRDKGLFSLFEPSVNLHPEWGEMIPLRVGFNNLPYIKGQFPGNINVHFMIDTGRISISNDLESQVFSKVISGNKHWNAHGYVYGAIAHQEELLNFAFLEGLSIGSFEYGSMLFKHDKGSILGLDFLAHHNVTFDFPHRRLYLKQLREFRHEEEIKLDFEEAGFKIGRENGRFIISMVIPEAIAHKKGLRAGDIVLRVNGQELSTITPNELLYYLSKLKGETEQLSLQVRRGEEILAFIFKKNDMDTE